MYICICVFVIPILIVNFLMKAEIQVEAVKNQCFENSKNIYVKEYNLGVVET